MIKAYSNLTIDQFNRRLSQFKNGLYIIGLDIHVGFIIKKPSKAYFIHSSYYNPPLAVVKEMIDQDMQSPLRDSKFRLMGDVLNDSRVIIKWLNHDSFKI